MYEKISSQTLHYQPKSKLKYFNVYLRLIFFIKVFVFSQNLGLFLLFIIIKLLN